MFTLAGRSLIGPLRACPAENYASRVEPARRSRRQMLRRDAALHGCAERRSGHRLASTRCSPRSPNRRARPRQPRPSTTATSSCVTAPPSTCARPARETWTASPPSFAACRPRRGGCASSGRVRQWTTWRGRSSSAASAWWPSPALTETIVAHAIFVPRRAIAPRSPFAVADYWQGLGASPRCCSAHLAQLAEATWHRDVRWPWCCIRATTGCFASSATRASPSRCCSEPGELHVELPSQLGPGGARALRGARPRSPPWPRCATCSSPRRSRSIGASRRRTGSVGGDGRPQLSWPAFAGADLSDQPARATDRRPASLRDRVADVPGPVELAVIAVPAPAVLEAARECAAQGVRALVVLSGGFGEVGPEGRGAPGRAAAHLPRRRACGSSGRTASVCSTPTPAVQLDATFAPGGRPPGASRSRRRAAPTGSPRSAWRRAPRASGLSSFVSMGDKADLSGNDFLRFWEQDDGTDVVLLVPRVARAIPGASAQIARRLTASKPVIAVKSGRTRRRAARGVVAHRCAAADLRGDRRRAVRARGRHPRPTRSTSSSTSPRCSRSRRCRGATASRSSPTPAARQSPAPTPAWRPACGSSRSRRRLAGRSPDHLPRRGGIDNPVDMLAAATSADFRRDDRARSRPIRASTRSSRSSSSRCRAERADTGAARDPCRRPPDATSRCRRS